MRKKTDEKKLISLGNSIRAAREKASISQEQLALLSGLDRSYMSRLERGLANPSYLALNTIASALQIPVPTLIGCNNGQEKPN